MALLKVGREAEYRTLHSAVFPEVLQSISKAGIRNYSIFLSGRHLFSYLETDDWPAAIEYLSTQPVCQQWQELMAPLMDASDPLAPWASMDEIFHLH